MTTTSSAPTYLPFWPSKKRIRKLKELKTLLSIPRGHDSAGEQAFLRSVLLPHKPRVFSTELYDFAYCLQTDKNAKTLFCAHIDTVHSTNVPVVVVERDGKLCSANNLPLGADDGAGVWLLLNLFRANVPGTFLFLRGEERGCWGASRVVEYHPEFLSQFDRAISFDRRGVSSVITYQKGLRCASDEFARALALALKENGLPGYSPDDTGIYTDTAEFIDLIPECTNLSVGYYNEHTPKETLDYEHLFRLLEACKKLSWETLPTVREPGTQDFLFHWGFALQNPQKRKTRIFVNPKKKTLYSSKEATTKTPKNEKPFHNEEDLLWFLATADLEEVEEEVIENYSSDDLARLLQHLAQLHLLQERSLPSSFFADPLDL